MSKPAIPDNLRMLPLAAVAEALASDERTVRRFIGTTDPKRRLPAAKIGGRWKVRLSDLNEFIERQTNRRVA